MYDVLNGNFSLLLFLSIKLRYTVIPYLEKTDELNKLYNLLCKYF